MKLSTASAILCTVLLASFCNAFPYLDYWDREAFLEQLQQEERMGTDIAARIEQEECTLTCESGRIFISSDRRPPRTFQRPQTPIEVVTFDCDSAASITMDGIIYIPRCFRPCPVLPITNDNLRVTYHGGNRLEPRDPDTEATYSCSGDYTLRGNRTRKCGRNGQWSAGEEPTCVALCPVLQNIPNGAVSFTSREPGATARYSCDPGYALSGAQIRTCGQDGKWSGQEPTCFPLCPIPSLPNGQVNHGNREPGDVAAYSCRSGYRLVGPKKRTCGQDGKWSGKEPFCEKIYCLLDPIPNEDTDPIPAPPPVPAPPGTLGYEVGTVIAYTCGKDFELRGESERICLENGTFNHPRPFCTPAKCPPLSTHGIPNSDPEVRRELLPYTIVHGNSVLFNDYFNRRIKGDRFEGSEAYLTCLESNGWTLMKGTPKVQICECNATGALDWTPGGTCVFNYQKIISHG